MNTYRTRRTQRGQGKYICDTCRKRYAWKHGLKKHIRYNCGAQGYSTRTFYPCLTCGKIYKWRESLNLHKRMECGIEPRFACNICGRKFKHKHHLMKHHNSIHNFHNK